MIAVDQCMRGILIGTYAYRMILINICYVIQNTFGFFFFILLYKTSVSNVPAPPRDDGGNKQILRIFGCWFCLFKPWAYVCCQGRKIGIVQ